VLTPVAFVGSFRRLTRPQIEAAPMQKDDYVTGRHHFEFDLAHVDSVAASGTGMALAARAAHIC
jgi:hypothetical protein